MLLQGLARISRHSVVSLHCEAPQHDHQALEGASGQQEQSQNGYKDNVPSVNDNVPLSRDELRRLEEEKIRRQDELDDMNGAS